MHHVSSVIILGGMVRRRIPLFALRKFERKDVIRFVHTSDNCLDKHPSDFLFITNIVMTWDRHTSVSVCVTRQTCVSMRSNTEARSSV